jgi:urate oxidase
VLKTTGSKFKNFIRDAYTTLAEVDDRIFSTSVDLSYTFAPINVRTPTRSEFFAPTFVANGSVWDCGATADRARRSTLEVFATDESASVQVGFKLKSQPVRQVLNTFPRRYRTSFPVTWQATLYKMAQRVIAENKCVDSVTYKLPNKHYIPVDMTYIGKDNITPLSCIRNDFKKFYN